MAASPRCLSCHCTCVKIRSLENEKAHLSHLAASRLHPGCVGADAPLNRQMEARGPCRLPWSLLSFSEPPSTSVFQMKPMNVEYLMMDASILLPPTGTPLTGIDFVKRLPCGDVEKTRRVSRHWPWPLSWAAVHQEAPPGQKREGLQPHPDPSSSSPSESQRATPSPTPPPLHKGLAFPRALPFVWVFVFSFWLCQVFVAALELLSGCG